MRWPPSTPPNRRWLPSAPSPLPISYGGPSPRHADCVALFNVQPSPHPAQSLDPLPHTQISQFHLLADCLLQCQLVVGGHILIAVNGDHTVTASPCQIVTLADAIAGCRALRYSTVQYSTRVSNPNPSLGTRQRARAHVAGCVSITDTAPHCYTVTKQQTHTHHSWHSGRQQATAANCYHASRAVQHLATRDTADHNSPQRLKVRLPPCKTKSTGR